MQAQEAGNDTVRLSMTAHYVTVLVVIVAWVTAFFFIPWYALVPTAMFVLWQVVRIAFRQATSITFEPSGVEVDLLFRKLHLRAPVTEFSGSRFHPVTVRDLHSGKTYDLTQFFGTRKLITVAESHGYAVVHRPLLTYR